MKKSLVLLGLLLPVVIAAGCVSGPPQVIIRYERPPTAGSAPIPSPGVGQPGPAIVPPPPAVGTSPYVYPPPQPPPPGYGYPPPVADPRTVWFVNHTYGAVRVRVPYQPEIKLIGYQATAPATLEFGIHEVRILIEGSRRHRGAPREKVFTLSITPGTPPPRIDIYDE